MKTSIVCVIMLCLTAVALKAQNYTISGYVSDTKSGEQLIGANVYEATSYKGTATNNYGFYSLTLPKGNYKIKISSVGYATNELNLKLDKNIQANLKLTPSIELEEVLVIENKAQQNVERTQMSEENLSPKTIKAIPALLGEVDVLKAIQLLPGVQSGSEGTSGFYVRGGAPDQNLILLDGVPVYNASHLFGFFSVFNADAISNVKLIKGGFPARYGGRLSSVLDIRMKEGNNKEFKGHGSIGLISSKLTLEGPLFSDKTSFIVSGRRTYIDVLSYPIQKIVNDRDDRYNSKVGYFFHDINAKVNHKFSDRSRIYLSTYMGKDKAYSKDKWEENGNSHKDELFLQWGNITTALRWNYMLNSKLFSNTTLTHSRYKFMVGESYEDKESGNKSTNEFEYSSGIYDYTGKIDFDYFPNPNHSVKFGISDIYHTFNPGVTAVKSDDENADDDINKTFGDSKIYAHELALYAEDDIKIGGRFKANLGLNYSGFLVNDKYYNSIEPRVALHSMLTGRWSLKAAYSQMNQYIHLLTNDNIGLPTDLWVPATDKIKPQKSTQYALGSVYAIAKNLDLSIEGFYKTMDNLIAYKEGASFLSIEGDWQDKIESGKGWSYGVELMLRKSYGKTTGWIGYTYAKSERQFEEISFGKIFPYKYDRRHDLSIVLSHKFNDRIDMGMTWVFATGNATTLAYEKYPLASKDKTESNFNTGYSNASNEIEYFETRNNYRMNSYHRLDVGINFHKEKRFGQRTWSFGAYNAYSRKNPFFLMFEENYKNNGETEKVLKQYSLFPIIPYLTYSFNF